MPSFAEYDQCDGTGLAELIRTRKVSAIEVCEEAVHRAEDLNPKLNAIITKTYDLARQTAQKPPTDAPFSGVPFLVKDAHHALKGFPMSCGSALLWASVPDYDAEIVRRFKEAGLLILGKSNTPEFKLAYVTEPKAFGPTRNPWNLDYSSGGSSGGSAAAVAARIVPLASATDEGGSIRVPASYCGLFGLKPSRGRNPVGPDFDEEWDGASQSHVITRTVRDSAAMLDAVCGYEEGAPYAIFTHERPFVEEVKIEPGKLRIAFHTRSAYGKKVHPECARAVDQTCRLLENLGHEVEEAKPDFSEEDAALDFTIVIAGNGTALIDKLIRLHGQARVKSDLEPMNYAMYSMGRSLKALDFVNAKRRWRRYGAAMYRMMKRYDMLLTPTLGEPPVPVGSRQPSGADRFSAIVLSTFAGRIMLNSRKLMYSALEKMVDTMMKGQMPFTFIANITGQPAMSVPLYWSQEGLPCGVQFIGRYGDEAGLLRLAGQLERAQPWISRRPRILQDDKGGLP